MSKAINVIFFCVVCTFIISFALPMADASDNENFSQKSQENINPASEQAALSKKDTTFLKSLSDIDQDGVIDQSNVISMNRAAIFSKNLVIDHPLNFDKVWDSDDLLGSSLWDSTVGDTDKDNRMEFISYKYQDGMSYLTIFENTVDNTYEEVYLGSMADDGEFLDFVVDDLDGDNFDEIIVGHRDHTIRFYENVADNLYSEWTPIDIYQVSEDNQIVREIYVANVDQQGAKEVVVLKSKIFDSTLKIYSILAENSYTEMYSVNDDALLDYGLAIGKVDTDAYPEIFIAHGGFTSDELFFVNHEYDGTQFNKYTHNFPLITGLPLAMEIADVDVDGTNELLVTGVFDFGIGLKRYLIILNSTADNTYEISESIQLGDGNAKPQDIYVGNQNPPLIAISTHNSGGPARVYIVSHYNGEMVVRFESSVELGNNGGRFYSVDLADMDNDSKLDIVIGANIEDKVHILEDVTDTDGDGVLDSVDNCSLVANADQRDTNSDGYGNICDPDLNNDNVVNFADVSLWVPFFSTATSGDADFNGDGSANFVDFALYPIYFLQPPGPSGIAP